jgi:hypothetical protein
MTSIAEDLRDAVHDELVGVAAALKPPDSGTTTKLAPDAGLLALLITQVLLPILTSVVSGILTHLATRGEADATQRKLSEFDSQLKALVQRDALPEQAFVDAVARTIAELPTGTIGLGEAAVAEVAQKVAAELQRYHLSDATSVRLGPIIVTRALAVLSAAAAEQA